MKRALIRPTDFIIVALIVAVAVASLFILAGGEGKYITVMQNGQVIKTVSLNKNGVYTVGAVTVTVEDGIAYVSDSDCEDKICMRTRLKYAGDCAICLPNKVSITVSGEAATDAVTY